MRANEVVAVRGVDFVVAEMRRVTKGRHAGCTEVTLAPLGEMRGSAYAIRGKTDRAGVAPWAQPARKSYTAEQRARAIEATLGKREEIREAKAVVVEAGRKVLVDESWVRSIYVGDLVTIKYSDAMRVETVAGVNYATGKVAIERSRNQSGKRWLPATLVLEVMSPPRPLQCSLSEREIDKLATDGWVQVRRGAEFIERSYVVAKTREGARKGIDYECASQQVFFDAKAGVYHRETGSFD